MILSDLVTTDFSAVICESIKKSKYIYWDKSKNCYDLKISKYDVRYYFSKDKFEEAVQYRDYVLRFFKLGGNGKHLLKPSNQFRGVKNTNSNKEEYVKLVETKLGFNVVLRDDSVFTTFSKSRRNEANDFVKKYNCHNMIKLIKKPSLFMRGKFDDVRVMSKEQKQIYRLLKSFHDDLSSNRAQSGEKYIHVNTGSISYNDYRVCIELNKKTLFEKECYNLIEAKKVRQQAIEMLIPQLEERLIKLTEVN